MKLSLLLSLISLNAFALDCDGVPEGQVFRIDQNNGSLSKAAIQDQDGLGSCFANQTSLLLQSVIPGNPNLSYLNLGVYYAADYNLAEQNKKGQTSYTTNNETRSGIVGGYACKTIKAALERQKSSSIGSLCRAEDVPLEHAYFKPDGQRDLGMQERLLTQASRYMNTYQSTFGFADEKQAKKQRESADQFKLALNRFIKDSGDSYFAKKCNENDPNKMLTLMENALTRTLNENTQCIAGKTFNTSSAFCKSLAQFGMLSPVASSGNSSKVKFIQSNETRQKLKNSTPALFSNKGGMNNFLDGFKNHIKSSDNSKTSAAEKEAFAKAVIAKISPADMKSLESDYQRIALKNTDNCKADNFLSYFKDKANFLAEAKKDVVLCNYSELLNRASDLASALPAKTFTNMTDFVDFITNNAGLKYDEAVLSLMANDCSVDKRIKLPESLSCEHVVPYFEPKDFPGNEIPAKTVKVIKENRKKMMANLQGNRGVGITICTKFWKDPSFDYNKEPVDTKAKTCRASGSNSFHSITTIGYRCKDNRIQYLAQNSWGPNWTQPESKLEIENGKVWMDEDKLFKNIESLDYITP